ncbi:MAG TPA: hypothetical protein ENH34_03715 [Phycisphaerales bacterium]|nr:hypothetical protein [Phycisphaerales bacterium]
MRKCVIGLLLAALTAGCASKDKPALSEAELERIPFAQREDLPQASGGFVLAVSGETITSDEVIATLIKRFRPVAQRNDFERFKEQAMPAIEQALVTKISNILLYNQAKKKGGADIDEALEKAAEAEVKRFIVSFEGDSAKAEQALRQRGMNWDSFKEYQKKMILSQSYISSQLPDDRPVTYSELVESYNKMKEEFFTTQAMLKFQLIDIQPAELEAADPNQSRLEQAEKLADELLERLQAGEDFGELARQYSHGYRRLFGGLWKLVQPDSLAKPYDILAAKAEKIEQGQIAGPIETDGHIFIMKLIEKRLKSFKPLEEVQKEVEAKIVFERRKEAIDELSAKLVQQAALGNNDEFIDFCVQKIYRMCNQ